MLEWLKRHAWKACIRQKRIASSNLAHSAKLTEIPQADLLAGFFDININTDKTTLLASSEDNDLTKITKIKESCLKKEKLRLIEKLNQGLGISLLYFRNLSNCLSNNGC